MTDITYDISITNPGDETVTADKTSLTFSYCGFPGCTTATQDVTLTWTTPNTGTEAFEEGTVTLSDGADCTKDVGFTLVDGDPHFSPLSAENNHIRYLVSGSETNLAIYNIITSPTFQLNARWIKYNDHPTGRTEVTLENYFALRRGGVEWRIKIAPDARSRLGNTLGALDVTVDGNAIAPHAPKRVIEPASENLPAITIQRSKDIVIVGTDEFFVVTYLLHNTRYMQSKGRHGNTPNKWPFLNTQFVVRHPGRLPHMHIHGLLGQTARAPHRDPTPQEIRAATCMECFVEGDIKDYQLDVNDQFGTDFPFNLY